MDQPRLKLIHGSAKTTDPSLLQQKQTSRSKQHLRHQNCSRQESKQQACLTAGSLQTMQANDHMPGHHISDHAAAGLPRCCIAKPHVSGYDQGHMLQMSSVELHTYRQQMIQVEHGCRLWLVLACDTVTGDQAAPRHSMLQWLVSCYTVLLAVQPHPTPTAPCDMPQHCPLPAMCWCVMAAASCQEHHQPQAPAACRLAQTHQASSAHTAC